MSEKFYIISWEDKDGNTHLHREEFMSKALVFNPPIPYYNKKEYKIEEVIFNR